MTINISEILDTNNNVDFDSLKSFGIEEIENLWNSIQVKRINGCTERDKIVKSKCIQVLETLYRKPWDETSKNIK